MQRQPYYPLPIGERAEWHTNFAMKLHSYPADLTLTQAEEDKGVVDNLTPTYGFVGWIVANRDHSTACRASLETQSYGTGSTNYVFPQAQLPPLPTLPVGIVAHWNDRKTAPPLRSCAWD